MNLRDIDGNTITDTFYTRSDGVTIHICGSQSQYCASNGITRCESNDILHTVGLSCQADYDLWQAAENCQGGACAQNDVSGAPGNLKNSILALYGEGGLVGTMWGCKDMSITQGSPHYATVTTGHNGNNHYHNQGTHCHGGWQSCGWRGCNWNGCKSSHTNHNQEYHQGHTSNVVASVHFDVIEKMFFGESRYKCQLGSSNTVTAYTHGEQIAQHYQQNGLNFFGDLMMWQSTGIAMGDAGAIDYKPACYSHYMNSGVEDADTEGNWATEGFLLAKDTNGVYKNTCNNCEMGITTYASQRTYSHYTTPKFHNYGYDKAGSGCTHSNSDASTSSCAQQCNQDSTIFNTGPNGYCQTQTSSWHTYYNECDTW